MSMKKTALTLALCMTAVLSGCASAPKAASGRNDDAAQRFGQYCEQLGNLKGTPEFDHCIDKMRTTYQ